MLRWKEIEGFPGYKVSDNGLVLGMKGMILKPSTNRDGYMFVGLYREKKYYNRKIHRLVAEAFVEGFRNGLVVNHINGNKRDNRASNLEWVTQAENARHAVVTGLWKPAFHTDKPIAVIREDGAVFPSMNAAARATGVTTKTVERAALGITKNPRIDFKKFENPSLFADKL